jgi:hypothetical protein
MVFDREGRLFVGDSTVKINVWRINITIDEVKDLDHFVIKHNELQGD